MRNREHLALVKTGPEPCRVADPDGKPQQLPSPTATVAAPRPLGASGPEPTQSEVSPQDCDPVCGMPLPSQGRTASPQLRSEPFFCSDPFGQWIDSILEDKEDA